MIIILDTSVYNSAQSFSSAPFLKLNHLMKLGLIKLYMPTIVKEERISQLLREVQKATKDINKGLIKYINLNLIDKESCDSFIKKITEITQKSC